jgi:hypothetical protein
MEFSLVCSIFEQLSLGSFKTSLTNILTLPLTSTNVVVYIYIVHEKASNYSDLLEVLANLSDAMVRKLPTETNVKTTKLLMERCQKIFTSLNVDPDTKQKTQTLGLYSASILYRPSDRRLSAKLVPTLADRGCRVVSATNPHGR